MKITTLVTCLAFVFGWATELLAQFVPVIAKQRSIHYLIQSDQTEVEVMREEGRYFRLQADYKIDDSTWMEETVLEIYAAGTPKHETPAGTEGEVSRGKQRDTLPDVAGTRLDGVEERLSDYRGRILLLDFWATWCGPCVAALPKIRELVAKLPADRFALVGISVDEELGTVTRFVEDEPMPWTNWHAGEGSELARFLRIRSLPTYVLADENGKILTRTGGLIPPFISLVEEAVDHLGKFGSTRRLDFEAMALRAGLSDPDARGGGAGAMRSSFYRMAVVLGVMAVLCLTIGLRGLLTKRPFLFPARWLFLFIMAMFLGPMVTLFPFSWPSQTMDWIPLLMLPMMAVFMWIQLKGYLAFGVTERSFREGLLAALEKLQLPCEESLSSIRLTSLGVDLQVAIQSWMGSGQIKVGKGRHGHLLKEIVQAMHKHFRASTVETNMISCVLYLILGIMMLLMVVATLFRWGPL